MNITEALLIIEIITEGFILAIVAIYACAAYWNIMFLINSRWGTCSPLYLFSAAVCLTVTSVFGYMFISSLLEHSIEVTAFSGMVLRPLMFLVGASSAGNALARYKALMAIGGMQWKRK